MTEAFHCQMKSDQPGKHQRSAASNTDQIDFDRVRVKSVFYRMFHFKRSPRVWLADFNNSTGNRSCFFFFRYSIQKPSCPPGCSICRMEWAPCMITFLWWKHRDTNQFLNELPIKNANIFKLPLDIFHEMNIISIKEDTYYKNIQDMQTIHKSRNFKHTAFPSTGKQWKQTV